MVLQSVLALFDSGAGSCNRQRSIPECDAADRRVHAANRMARLDDAPGPRHSLPMPRDDGLPPGTLVLLILRVLASQPLHGYAIAQRISQLSESELSVEEGSLYPALQKLLLKGWVKAADATSESGRAVRQYRLTPAGRKQLEAERDKYRVTARAIALVLERA